MKNNDVVIVTEIYNILIKLHKIVQSNKKEHALGIYNYVDLAKIRINMLYKKLTDNNAKAGCEQIIIILNSISINCRNICKYYNLNYE